MTANLSQTWETPDSQMAVYTDPPIPDDIFPVPGGKYGHEVCARKIFPTVAKSRDMFIRGTTVTETTKDALGDYILKGVSPERFVCKIEHYGLDVARHEVVEEVSGDGKKSKREIWRRTTFPVSSAKMALVSNGARDHLPCVRQLLSCPVAIPDANGIRILGKGWHSHAGGTLIMSGRVTDDVPLDVAITALLDLLSDFSFQSPGDMSRGVATFLSPALKFGQWISDDFPLDLSEADKSQGGKTYRFKMLSHLYGCQASAITNDPRGGLGTLDEKVSKALIEGKPFISLQNIRGRVDSTILEEAIRGQGVVSARALRESADVDTSVFLWQLSTNGADLTRDLANRSIVTRIRKQPADYQFRRSVEGDVVDHIKANRHFLLGCVFSILREWATRGRPCSNENRHDFRGWVRSLDYMVQEIMGMARMALS